MTKKRFLFASLLTTLLTFSNVSNVMAIPLDLSVSIVDPDEGQVNEHRGPVVIPEVDLVGSTLTFVTPCDGSELRIINEDGEVAYTTVINSTSLVLPSYLSGEYRIEIISGNFCFWGYIEL